MFTSRISHQPNVGFHTSNSGFASSKSGQMVNQLVLIKNRTHYFPSEIFSEKQKNMAFIAKELKKLVDAPKFWEEIKRIGSSLSKEQMENIQNEFQNAIKTEQFDDKTIQDLYKRTNKMFKEDSILRSYFPGYSKQKTKPLMDVLNNLKKLGTPTKDSMARKIVKKILTMVNVGAAKSSGMTTSSTEGGALEGFLGAATTISFNGLEQRTSERKEHESRDTKKAENSAHEEAEKYERRAALRDENSLSVEGHAIYCEVRYQLQILKEKQTHLESAEKMRSTETPEKVGMNHGSSIPQHNLVEKGIDDNHHLPPPLPPKTKRGSIDNNSAAPALPPKPNATKISKQEENKPPILPPKPNFNKTHSINDNKIEQINHNNNHDRPKGIENLKEDLIRKFGIKAAQYLRFESTLPDGEKLAAGLYTNGIYSSLNQTLRENNQDMNEGNTMVHRGLTSAFEMQPHNKKLIKTYRGVKSHDVFDSIPEGKSACDAGYMSTSRKLNAAKGFSNGMGGSISVIFGQSGMDVSHLSIEGKDEAEVLYKNNTQMTVLFSEMDKNGITRRVLNESGLSDETGMQKRLVNALDLSISNDKRK